MQKKVGMILGIVIALLIVAVPYIKHNQETKVIEEKIEDLRAPIVTFSGIISRLEIKDDTVLVLEKKGDKWIEPGYLNLNYDNEQIDLLFETLLSLHSEQVIYNIQDPQKYGIGESSRIITAYNEENSSQTIKIGEYTPDKIGRYVWNDTNETISIVNSEALSPLLDQKENLVDKKMILPEINGMQTLKITKRAETPIILEKHQELGREGYEEWAIKGFFVDSHQIETESVEALIAQIETFQKDKFVSMGTEEDKQQYDLKEPLMSLSINEDWQINFGKAQDGYVYFTYNREPYIYKMLEDKVKVFSNIKPIEMIRKQVYLPQLEQVESIVLVNPQETFTIEILKNEVGIQDDASLEGMNAYTGQLGDLSLDRIQTKALIETIGKAISIEMLLQNPQIEQKEERKAEVTITYHLASGESKLIELVPYDINFYVLRVDGIIEFAVGKQSVMDLFNQINELSK